MTKVVATPRFAKLAKKLRKKYPNVWKDVQPLREQLESGETPGDRVQNVSDVVYKVRLRNRDVQRGKSGGYRVMYYLKAADRIYLILIYSKSEIDDVPVDLITQTIREVEDEALEE